jgi:hypothetical protein
MNSTPAHVAVLVQTAHRADPEQAVADPARHWEGRIDLRLLGPPGPYDFVSAPTPPS